MRGILIAVSVVCLSGCASVLGFPPPRAVMLVDDDPFSRLIAVGGIERQRDTPVQRHFLRSWVDRDSAFVEHQLYVRHNYTYGWQFFSRANGQDANPLEFTEIDRDVNCASITCIYYETFGITVSDSLLRANPTGYQVKAYAQSGDELLLSIDAEMIASQLATIDSIRGRPFERASAPSPTATPASPAPDAGGAFIAFERDRIYYPADCAAWRDLPQTDTRWFFSRSGVEAAGYTRVSVERCP